MKGSGPKHERETTINFNEEEDIATIWTASLIVYQRLLKRLGRAYLTEDGERHAVFSFPKVLIVLPRYKVKKAITPEQRSKMATRMAATRQNIRAKGASGGISDGEARVQ